MAMGGHWRAMPGITRMPARPRGFRTHSAPLSGWRMRSTRGFRVRGRSNEALAEYHRKRDEHLRPVYELTCGLATLAPPPPGDPGALRSSHPQPGGDEPSNWHLRRHCSDPRVLLAGKRRPNHEGRGGCVTPRNTSSQPVARYGAIGRDSSATAEPSATVDQRSTGLAISELLGSPAALLSAPSACPPTSIASRRAPS